MALPSFEAVITNLVCLIYLQVGLVDDRVPRQQLCICHHKFRKIISEYSRDTTITFLCQVYLTEEFSYSRILRWVREEEEQIQANNGNALKCVILDMTGIYEPFAKFSTVLCL